MSPIDERHVGPYGLNMPFRHFSEDVLELLSVLGDVGARFLASTEGETVAAQVFNALSTRLDLGIYLNYLLADDGRTLQLNSYAGFDEATAASMAELKLGEFACGTVALTRERLVAEDVQRGDSPLFGLAKTLDVTAYACHPLLAGERLIGTLSFGSRTRERFTRVELELMQTVATFAALAIDRATVSQRHRRAQVLLARAQEDERRRMSRELHDEMAQQLAALRLELETLDGLIPATPEAAAKLLTLQHLVNEIGRGAHHIALELRPVALDDLGLQLALTNYIEEWSQRYGLPIDLHVSGLERRAPEEVETAIYRIVQEALTNVAKHAQASRVSVIVQAVDHHVQAIIEDNGIGFDDESGERATPASGLGLAGMEERASLLGGSLTVERASPQGTSIYARIPTHGASI
jgi:signal transduction histidine kinase